jgi:shikimate dehydrogenase
MLKVSQGHVVNIDGGAARTPSAEFLIGGSVNAAMANFSKGLSQLGKRDGVNVNVIHPGTTETERNIQLMQQRAAATGKSVDEQRAETLARSGIRRVGKPQDIAELALFLCSERARHIQGTAIAVDGGATVGYYRNTMATDKARAACVIGWPVEHSRSPLIHNYWLKELSIPGEYRREAVQPEQFGDFIKNLGARGYVGANVTLPHKQAALALSKPDARAKAVGAANTLWFDGGLHSTNTDVEGFLANLDASAPNWGRGLTKAVVLGAGGASRAVIYGLIERGVEWITVVNRTASRVQALQQRFGQRVHSAQAAELNNVLADAGLLVNTTTLGMRGQPPLAIDLRHLPASAVVADAVYVPLVTPLLAAARERGLRTADGLGMLLHQAVRGFTLWFGVHPQVTAQLRSMIEADIARQ